jgi:CheY-like chemotaxis protein
MSKHPEAQGDGAGRAMDLDPERRIAESLAEGHSHEGHSHDSHGEHAHGGHAHGGHAHDSHEGHSHGGHSHGGHSHEARSHGEHSHGEHSHEAHSHDGRPDRPHAHTDGGAQAQRSRAADSRDATRVPCIVIVDDDVELCEGLSLTIGASCQTHCVAPAGAVALLKTLLAVDVALVDCDPPPSVQAPIFGELARWPAAICVLMSANAQKVEQFRALGVFAPLVLDKPVHPEALEAIRSATLELCRALG